MSRKSKNIIILLLIVLLVISNIVTFKFAKDSMTTINEVVMENGGSTPPEMPSGDNNNSSMAEPPEKPSGDMGSNGEMTEPPAKPEGESNQGDNASSNQPPEIPNGGNNQGSGTNSSQPPELPEGANGNGEMMPQGENQSTQEETSSNKLSVIYYVLFTVETLALSSLVIYLIMSKFNEKSLKETLKSTDKVVIYILSIIIATAVLTIVESYIVNNSSTQSTKQETNEPSNNFGGAMNNSNVSYNGAKEISSDEKITSGEYTSTEVDENAILVNGKISVTLSDIEVTKTGDSDGGDNTSFYGINSAITAKSGATLTIKNATIKTDATGANGVFSYGGSATTNNSSSDGTTINISDSTITTSKDNSGGIMTTGGGITNATNLTITTSGVSSAAIRTDRGGGTVNVDGGTYTTKGSGSPAVYSTGEITVKNANLVSKVAEGIVIEGKNSVTIENCTLTDNNTKLNGLSTTYKNIFLYQSMSGDADTGNSTFTAKNNKITTNNGDSFYITNTTATINLTNNTIINNDSKGNFLRAQADSWGNKGSNGGDVTLNLNNQSVTGNIVIDEVSTLKMTMKESSSYEGTINSDNNAKEISLTLDKTSTIKLTGNSYVTSFTNADTKNSNIDFNGYKLYVNGKAIN